MHYKTILNQIKDSKKDVRVPTVKKLKKSVENGEILIIYGTLEGIGKGLTIFSDGSIVYGDGENITVFAFVTFLINSGYYDEATRSACEEYINDPRHEVLDIYGVPRWQRELILFAEDRIAHNKLAGAMNKEFLTDDIEKEADEHRAVKDISTDIINQMYVADLLDCLTKKQRYAVEMYFFDGYTYEEIAIIQTKKYRSKGIIISVTEQSIRQLVVRALAKMRVRIPDYEKFI